MKASEAKRRAATLTDAKAAKRIREAADRTEAFKSEYLPGGKWYDPNDEEANLAMARMYEDDAWALRGIADLVAAGEREAALRGAFRLDTACREEIPGDAWLHIGGELLGCE
jgi:hypothetical protein